MNAPVPPHADGFERLWIERPCGARLALYRRRPADGEAGGPALLLAHAAGFAALAYRGLLDTIAPHADIFAFDLRGHGNSSPETREDAAGDNLTPDIAGAALLGEDLRAVADHVRRLATPRRLILFAHSLSGAIALAQSATRPPWDMLVTYDAAVFPPQGHPEHGDALALLEKRVRSLSRRRDIWPEPAAYEAFLRERAFAEWPPGAIHDFVRATTRPGDGDEIHLLCDVATETAAFAMLPQLGASLKLRDVDLPVVLLAADPASATATWASRMQPFLAEALPRARLVTLAGMGHLAPVSHPGEVARAILKTFPVE